MEISGRTSDDGPGAELEALLLALERRVAAAVSRTDGVEPAGDHPLRGLYLSHEQAVGLLAESAPAPLEPSPPPGPVLAALAARCGLDPADIDILVSALAPDVDPRYEKLYGFVHDDLTKRRATIGLVMQLCGLSPRSADRARFDRGAPLVANGLLVVDDPDRPFLSRVLRVPDHVASVLLGSRDLEPILAGYVVEPIGVTTADVSRVARVLTKAQPVHLTEGAGGAAVHVSASAACSVGRRAIVLDVASVAATDMDPVITAAIRHHALGGDLLIVRPVEAIAEHAQRRLADLTRLRDGVVLVGAVPWNPSWATEIPHHVDIADLSDAESAAIWQRSFAEIETEPDAVDAARRSYRLTPEQIRRTARAAALVADGGPIGFRVLSASAKSQSAAGLDRLARRLQATASWSDLVLPANVMILLDEIVVRVRWREQVMQQWGLGRGWRGRGLAALFAGPSGTGKTTAAEVIAGELGYDIHIVDLSTVVDKYIGETEKKLEVIFTEAERSNTVLLFDEADAIFGKRSEVKDAKDRYANIEVSYLLQRIERFSGLAILTTNLGANLDEAFTRRLDVVVDFPRPDAAAREAIWRNEFRPGVPTDGVDFEFCASAFDLTGGNIRNIVITAAYLAADAGSPVTMQQVVTAVQREFHKMGRLNIASEFGAYRSLLA
ncbi:MAG: ATP-binding protein [Ilumatobacteraceae bacterium]